MDNIFVSIFSDEFCDYLRLLSNSGQQIRKYLGTFKSLDAYIANTGVCEKELTEQLVNGWLNTLKCRPKTKGDAICRIRKFSRYLIALEIPAYEENHLRHRCLFTPTLSERLKRRNRKMRGSSISQKKKSVYC